MPDEVEEVDELFEFFFSWFEYKVCGSLHLAMILCLIPKKGTRKSEDGICCFR